MADTYKEVSLGDLGPLPFRAHLAYALRCAGRVRPLLVLPDSFPQREAAFQVIDRALAAADAVARGEQPPLEYLQQLSQAVEQVADAASDINQWTPYAAVHAIKAAVQVVQATPPASSALIYEMVGSAYGASRVLFGAYEKPVAGRIVAALRTDFDRLVSLNLGQRGEPGAPVDPSEGGPLGPYWPEGAPETF